jgi:hypothetical protein
MLRVIEPFFFRDKDGGGGACCAPAVGLFGDTMAAPRRRDRDTAMQERFAELYACSCMCHASATGAARKARETAKS